jgi:hypothetical protein
MAATRQKVGDGISRTSAISGAPDTENRALGVMECAEMRSCRYREDDLAKDEVIAAILRITANVNLVKLNRKF